MIFSIKPQIFELKCVFSYFRLKTHITLLLPVYVHSWEQRKLSDCAGFRRGSFPQPYGNKDWYDGEGAMPFVQVADVSDDMKLVDDTKQKISKLAQPMSVCAEEGSVLVTLQGSIGRVAIMQYKAFVDRTVLIFDKYNADIDKTFWAYIIKEKFIEEARKAPGGTIKTITKEVLSDFDLMLPSYDEQKMLGKLLHSLDHLITLHQCKCQIDGCRFQSPLAITWEQRKVTEIGKIYIGLVTTMTKHYTDEGTLLIRNSDIKDGKFEFGDNPIYLEKTFAEKNETRMHQIGDVITVHTGDVGTSAVITENEAKSIGFATIVTRPNPKIIDSNYLCSFLNTDKHKKWAVSISTGDGRTNYNLGDYFELVVPVPSIAEQKKIASYIQKLNRLITLHQCE